MIFRVLKFFWVLGSLETSLLCIMGELAVGGSVAVAVSLSDRRQVTVAPFCLFLSALVLVLLSTHIILLK